MITAAQYVLVAQFLLQAQERSNPVWAKLFVCIAHEKLWLVCIFVERQFSGEYQTQIQHRGFQLKHVTALWVKAHLKWSLEILRLCLSFYLPPNISDSFFNWAPHLSASKYSRYIFWGQNAQFSIGTREEKGRVECLWEVQIFYPGIVAQIFEEKYL